MKDKIKQKQINKLGKFACKVCEKSCVDDNGVICCLDFNIPSECYICYSLGKTLFDAGARIPVSDDPLYNSWLNFATFVNELEKGNR